MAQSSTATDQPPPRPSTRRGLRVALLIVPLLVSALFSCGLGDKTISAGDVLSAITGIGPSVSEIDTMVVRDIRLPRMLCAALTGCLLALAGTALQAIFRNPLADPQLIGVSAGGAVGAIIFIVFGGLLIPQGWVWLNTFGLIGFPMVGAAVTSFIVYHISQVQGRTRVGTLLLSGIAMNSIAGAVTGYAIFFANDDQLRDFTFWSLGSFASATWRVWFLLIPVSLVFTLLLWRCRQSLNLLLLGEFEALHLGVPVERVRRVLILSSAAAAGLTVSFFGMIMFVGLVTPHLCRLFVGPDHRYLIPGSALLGATLLITADLFARIVVPYSELPVGVLTATVGGPFFLLLIYRSKLREDGAL